VRVFEKKPVMGGKARSIPVLGSALPCHNFPALGFGANSRSWSRPRTPPATPLLGECHVSGVRAGFASHGLLTLIGCEYSKGPILGWGMYQ
jgi:hypothetical protein